MPDSSDNVNSGARASAVDWSRPIEANDGSVATYTGQSEAGYYRVKWSDRDGDSRDHWFDENGKSNVEPSSLWMRNVQPTTPERDPAWGEIRDLDAARKHDAALWDRMVALVRRMAGNSSMGEPYEEDRVITHSSDHYCEARAIVADLPKPVDPDLIEARKLVPPHVPSWGPDDHARCVDGEFDANLFVIIALAAIKRGRELAAPEVSHVG